MNPSPFEEFGQRLAAEHERVQRMVRTAEPLGERLGRELAEAERLSREIVGMSEFTRHIEATELVAREFAKTEAFSRSFQAAEEAARRANAATLAVIAGPSLSETIVREVERQSAEASKFASELAKPVKLPDNWLDNLRVERRSYGVSLPKFKSPKGCALAKLQRMTDVQIRDFLDGDVSTKATQLALHELAQRRLDRISSKITRVEATINRVDRQNSRTQRLVIVLAIVAVAVGALQCVIAWVKP